ncbi:hypothetical protein BDR26DRAFT_863380 [Obelidium mucronatum]|nr:hypothetical protein BDR26DRAFT_863380 [Obelidium mucronatum]
MTAKCAEWIDTLDRLYPGYRNCRTFLANQTYNTLLDFSEHFSIHPQKPITTQLLYFSVFRESTLLKQWIPRLSASTSMAALFWKRTQSILRQLHNRLWSDIIVSKDALDLLPLHGGTPLALLAFANFARDFNSKSTTTTTSTTWFNHLMFDLEPHDSESYQVLCSCLRLPFRSPKAVLEMWAHKITVHFKETMDMKPSFELYMHAVAETRRASTLFERPDASGLIRAFSQYTLLQRDPSFKPSSPTDHSEFYPNSLDESTDFLNRVFLSLFTITMGCQELKDQVGFHGATDFETQVLDAYRRVEPPSDSFSLFHYYPVEVRAFRSLRLPHGVFEGEEEGEEEECHVCVKSNPRDLVVEAIQNERWLDRPMASCGISRYHLPFDILDALSRLSESEMGLLGNDELAVVEKVAAFELFQAAFNSSSRFCGPAGTVWQFCLLWRISGGGEMDWDTAIMFIHLMWSYMGALHHTRGEIIWIVGNEFGLDMFKLCVFFQDADAMQ